MLVSRPLELQSRYVQVDRSMHFGRDYPLSVTVTVWLFLFLFSSLPDFTQNIYTLQR